MATLDRGDVVSRANSFDPTDEFWNKNYHEAFGILRDDKPTFHSSAHGGFWVFTRYEDVRAIAQDSETFTTVFGKLIPDDPSSRPRIRPGELDGTEHREYRRVLQPTLTKQVIEPLVPRFRETANLLIDSLPSAGECDIAREFSLPYPALCFFKHVLEAPDELIPEIRGYVDKAIFSGDPEVSSANYENIASWGKRFLESRKRDAPSALISALIEGEVQGRPLTELEQMETMIPLMIGGLDTSSSVIGTGILILAQDQQLQRTLKEQPTVIPSLVEEFLRLGAPSSLIRTATRDVEISGVAIRRGERVMIPYPVANRDPAEFDNPGSVDLDRPRNRHFAFGAGPHRCVGSNLARITIRVAFEVMSRRFDSIELQKGAHPRYEMVQLRSLRELPIAFTLR